MVMKHPGRLNEVSVLSVASSFMWQKRLLKYNTHEYLDVVNALTLETTLLYCVRPFTVLPAADYQRTNSSADVTGLQLPSSQAICHVDWGWWEMESKSVKRGIAPHTWSTVTNSTRFSDRGVSPYLFLFKCWCWEKNTGPSAHKACVPPPSC